MTSVSAKSISETNSTFLNLFHPEDKQLIQRAEGINDRIDRHEVSVLSNQI